LAELIFGVLKKNQQGAQLPASDVISSSAPCWHERMS